MPMLGRYFKYAVDRFSLVIFVIFFRLLPQNILYLVESINIPRKKKPLEKLIDWYVEFKLMMNHVTDVLNP